MQVKIGDQIKFLGYDENVPEEERILTADEVYVVSEVDEAENSVSVAIENPDFNSKKKESESNPKTLLIEVFAEEFEAVAPARGKAKAAPAKGNSRTRPAAEEPADDAEGEDAGDGADAAAEEAPPTRAKPAAKAAPKAAAKPAGKTAAKPAGKTAAKPAPKGKAAADADAEGEEEDKYGDLEEQDEDQEILQMVQDADDVLALAQEVAEESAVTDYRLGGILFHVRKSGAYKTLDPKYAEKGGFGLYVSEQLNVEYRKAMYLVDIYYKTNKMGLSHERITAIGWSKAARICAVMDETNAEELLELAESMPVSELTENIKTNYKEVGGTKGEKKKVKLFKFKLFEDKAVSVEEVLNNVASAMGMKDLSDAFEHIVMEWATEHPIKKPSATKAAAPARTAPTAKAAAPAAKPAVRPGAKAAPAAARR